ncbi:alpha amylase catalytic sub domain protein [Segniliparus rotundus DSM 44985]|uniref:Alpha-1,4-glucan:maltose-1-phosphate maltosyltransferase n=1 Tax=Segniliparus rotundus (strain ATCC BAA-972 / CDC 1076 / CIP 108378 / DSM 44985 / JCM 13578) TaxID=640132 RepID=D6Z8K6_SEGRD|nr:alpha-1,4-glucan--maltose-1-phosphate maltosyltransferase [Segniliparus rotundus]ADG98286.1 alpha amylase catalytic sub domain protein [Segniliparus rotundus DSM 44985]
MTARLVIDDIAPAVGEEPYPAKAVLGELFPVRAVVWGDGHDALGATVVATAPGSRNALALHMRPGSEPDTFHALLPLETQGLWQFRVDAWRDPYTTWRGHIEAFLATSSGDVEPTPHANEAEEGARILARAQELARGSERKTLAAATRRLRCPGSLRARAELAVSADVVAIMRRHPVRELVTRGRTHRVFVERGRAARGAWYEFFPRSTGGWSENGSPKHGTFATAEAQLERAAAMGFDVVYLPPVHPIGTTARKGRNNALVADADDVGSPWAIGAAEGGHDAIHPQLGDEKDFQRFVSRAGELGLEVALDLALQCSPDHPWVQQHPQWFTTRPDGTIACAENPPKKYQDIYPLNFDNDPGGLRQAVLAVVLKWIGLGVQIFRVDNPHTKPPDFWSWLIARIWQEHPDVVFLSEAFTRPARLYGLAKLGFSQSYTYFTWRGAKRELTEFMADLVEHADVCRPNLFVNTPDILTDQLVRGGEATFASRAALAATLGPSWGMYSGYELYEHLPVRPGSEEYLDSEKYELRPRDFAGALRAGRSLEPWIAKLNAIRKAHPALGQLRTLRFHYPEDDAVIAYSKHDPASGDAVLVVVTLDPQAPRETTLWLDLEGIGQEPGARFPVRDEVTGQEWEWGHGNYVRLDPAFFVAHIIALPTIPAPTREVLAYRR